MSQIESQHQSEVQDSSNQSVNTEQIREKITLTTPQLRQISNDDVKFFNTINQTNAKAIEKINNKLSKEALVYLSQAERILEYGACCGKVIDRNLIISTLHNQASAYQRLWALDKCSKYIEAVIYNIESSLKVEETLFDKINLNQSNLPQKQLDLISSVITKKIFLVEYYLQYCAIMSQSKLHDSSLKSATKSLNIIKEVIQSCYQYYKIHMYQQKQQLEATAKKLKYLKQITFNQQIQSSNYEKLYLSVKKSLAQWKSIKQLPKKQSEIINQWIQTYAIGSVMQIQPKQYKQFDSVSNLSHQFTYKSIINKILLYTVCCFTIGTQMRLMQNQKRHSQQQKIRSYEYQRCQMYHLRAIQIFCTYIPYQSHFVNHVLNSYSNHYKKDLNSEFTFQQTLKLQSYRKEKQQFQSIQKVNLNPTQELKQIQNQHNEGILNTKNNQSNQHVDKQDSNQFIIKSINHPKQKKLKKKELKNKNQTSKSKIPNLQFTVNLNQNINEQKKLIKKQSRSNNTILRTHRITSSSKEKQKQKQGENNFKRSLQKNKEQSRKDKISPKFDQTKKTLKKTSKSKNKQLSLTHRQYSKKGKTLKSEFKQQWKVLNEYQLKKTVTKINKKKK